MGINDAREQLEVAKAECARLEGEVENLRTTAAEDLRMIRKLEGERDDLALQVARLTDG